MHLLAKIQGKLLWILLFDNSSILSKDQAIEVDRRLKR